MKMMTFLFALTVTLFCVSVGYWLWQAHKAAKRNRELFEPRPATPSPSDSATLQRLHEERYWRDYDLPAILRKQAE